MWQIWYGLHTSITSLDQSNLLHQIFHVLHSSFSLSIIWFYFKFEVFLASASFEQTRMTCHRWLPLTFHSRHFLILCVHKLYHQRTIKNNRKYIKHTWLKVSLLQGTPFASSVLYCMIGNIKLDDAFTCHCGYFCQLTIYWWSVYFPYKILEITKKSGLTLSLLVMAYEKQFSLKITYLWPKIDPEGHNLIYPSAYTWYKIFSRKNISQSLRRCNLWIYD